MPIGIPDEGTIELDGKPVHFKSPIEARRHGIETVYQELAVAPAMSIAENLFLGREIRRESILGSIFRSLDKKKMLAEAVSRMNDLKVGNMVLEMIRRLRYSGLPVILISHNMPLVFEVADRKSVV